MAEGVGFEPTVGFPTSDFESDTLDHSATLPCLVERHLWRHTVFLQASVTQAAVLPMGSGTRSSA
jgi:hypothetical protein